MLNYTEPEKIEVISCNLNYFENILYLTACVGQGRIYDFLEEGGGGFQIFSTI